MAYGMRACLAVAIVEMVEPVNRTETNSSVCSMTYDGFEDAVAQVNAKKAVTNSISVNWTFFCLKKK